MDLQLSSAAGALADFDFRAEGVAELLLQRGDVLASWAAAFGGDRFGTAGINPAARFRVVGGADGVGNKVLDCTHAELLRDDPAAELDLLALVAERQQRSGVPLPDRARANLLLHFGGQFKQPNQVGDRRAVDLNPLRQLFLRASILLEIALKRRGFFERIEVFSLDIFDNCQLCYLSIVGVADLAGDLSPAGLDRGAQSALAGDQLEPLADAADDHWLDDAVLADAFGERVELGVVEILSRLITVGVDGEDVELDQAGVGFATAGINPAARWAVSGFVTAGINPRLAGPSSGKMSRGRPRRASSPLPKRRGWLIMAEYLHAKFDIRPSAARARGIVQYRLSVAGGFGHRHISRNHGVENDLAEKVADLGVDLACQLE